MNDNCNYIGICAKTPADVRNSTIVANAGRFNGKADPPEPLFDVVYVHGTAGRSKSGLARYLAANGPGNDFDKRLGTAFSVASVVIDGVELVSIFVPIPGVEDAAARFDLGVTTAASIFNSESGFLEQPCDQCPFMAVYVSQDALIAGGDLAAGLVAKAGLTLISGPVGYVGGKGVDVLTTAVNGAHDFARTFMGLPVYVQVGVSGSGRATVIVYDGYSDP
jgi:hypothetical protein